MSEGLLGGQVNTDDLQTASAPGSNTGESCSPLLLRSLLPTWTLLTHGGRDPSWATAHQQGGCRYAHNKRAFPSDLHSFAPKASLKPGQRLHVFFHKYLLSTWCRNTSCALPRAAPSLHRRKRLCFQPATVWPTSLTLESFLEQNHYPEAFLLSLLLTTSTKLPLLHSFNTISDFCKKCGMTSSLFLSFWYLFPVLSSFWKWQLGEGQENSCV